MNNSRSKNISSKPVYDASIEQKLQATRHLYKHYASSDSNDSQIGGGGLTYSRAAELLTAASANLGVKKPMLSEVEIKAWAKSIDVMHSPPNRINFDQLDSLTIHQLERSGIKCKPIGTATRSNTTRHAQEEEILDIANHVFSKHDRDHIGCLNSSELKNIINEFSAQLTVHNASDSCDVSPIMQFADRNKDGKLSQSEFENLVLTGLKRQNHHQLHQQSPAIVVKPS